MCAGGTNGDPTSSESEAFALGNVDGLALELTPDYNLAPQTMQPVIVWDEHEGTETSQSA
jgi:hypothetical protein